MFIGVAVLFAACVYVIIFRIISALKENSQTRKNEKHRKERVDKNFIVLAFGVVLFIVAYVIIVPVPEPGTVKWWNSTLFLRLFWKVFGSLFAASGSFIIASLIGIGIGTLFNKREKASRRKRKFGWRSLEKDEALAAFNELYSFEKRKVEIIITSQNVTNAHEGYYGRFDNKIEQVAKMAPLAEVRSAAIQKLRRKNLLESFLSVEKDESVRKTIEIEIAKRDALRY